MIPASVGRRRARERCVHANETLSHLWRDAWGMGDVEEMGDVGDAGDVGGVGGARPSQRRRGG